MILCRRIDSPIGPLMLAADDAGLRHIEFRDNRHPANRADWHGGDNEVLQAAEAQLGEYFAGRRQRFELPLAPQGTGFQLRVWWELARIQYGETISYAQLAQRLDNPNGTRAVGAANGRNPLPIVLPCHRVIGADGSLTGFSGGLPTKRFLLELEGALPRQAPAPDLFAGSA